MSKIKTVRKVERWTVERCDADNDMYRIECVPATAVALLQDICEKGLSEGNVDDLSFWDVDDARSIRVAKRDLTKKLGFGEEVVEILTENMVFLAVFVGRKKKPYRILHETQAARELSKDLYARVMQSKEVVK